MNYRVTLLLIALLGFIALIDGKTNTALLNHQLKGVRCGAQFRVFNAYYPNQTTPLNVRINYGLQGAGRGNFVGERNVEYGDASSYLNVPGGLVNVIISYPTKKTLAKVRLFLQDGGMYTLAVVPFDSPVHKLDNHHASAKIINIKNGLPEGGKPHFVLYEEDATPAPVGNLIVRVYQVSLYNDSIDSTVSVGSAKSFIGSLKHGDYAVSAPLAGGSVNSPAGSKISVSFQVSGASTTVIPAASFNNGFNGFYYDVFLYGNKIVKGAKIPNTLSTTYKGYLPTQDRYGCTRFGPTASSSKLFPPSLLELQNDFLGLN